MTFGQEGLFQRHCWKQDHLVTHNLVLRSSEMYETAAATYTTTVPQLPTFWELLEPFPKGAGLDDQGY